jgi:cytochrome c556
MRRILTVAVLVVAGATAVSAQNLEAIKARQDLLEAMGKAAKAPGAMLKGEAKFDLAKVQAALKVIQENAPKLPDLFPEDSKTGGDTEALPVIWEKKDDVVSRFKKLVADAKTAESAITDDVTFQTEWPKVAGNCGGCHKIYRQKKK